MSFAISSLSRRKACTETMGTPRQARFLTPAAVYGGLGFAILLFFLQTLPYLSYRWLPDESWYSGPAYSMVHGNGIANPAFGPNELENHIDARPPGTAIVIAAAFRLFGTSSISARLGSILAGVAIILLTYRMARDVIGVEGALVATFLVATDNLVVLTSRSARPEALTTMAILASLLAMKQYAQKGRIVWAFLSGILIAAGTVFHITLLGYIVSIGILAIVLDRGRGAFPLRGATGYGIGYGLGLVPFAAWILTAPLGRSGFRAEYLSRAGGTPLWSKFLHEGLRYSDLLGLNMFHGHGMEFIPVRLPIPLFFMAASFLLWKLRPRWFYLELLLLTPTVFWLIYTVNKTSRYFALLAPVFALVIGAAVAASSSSRRLHRVLLSLSCLLVAAQMSANVFLLHAASKANYDKVTAELRSVIPPGQTAYGTVTFWLALHDHPYIAYERTDPWMAANQFHARYFITGDRVMTSGLQGDEAFYESLRRSMAEVIDQSTLVGRSSDLYYGDLKVYKLNEP
ncbi:MAG: glycosyltransferase family 39 protein [Terracidiphilus sp.]|jgi:4-amino-4-deoxy-L-arabinose transferase-like glycosyltransferase